MAHVPAHHTQANRPGRQASLQQAEAQGEMGVVNLLIQEGAALSLATRVRIYWRKAASWKEYDIILLVLRYLVDSVIWEAVQGSSISGSEPRPH